MSHDKIWTSWFRLKSKSEQQTIIKTQIYRVAAMHLAAIKIQSMVRGNIVRSGRLRFVRGKKKRGHPIVLPDQKSLFHKYQQEVKESDGQMPFGYIQWCARRLQAWWRMISVRVKFVKQFYLLENVASTVVQNAWRAYYQRRFITVSLLNEAARLIQKSWKSYTNTRIYNYYKDLILFREQGDPAMMLRTINPREAGLIDSALGVHVRFRLGGEEFPPTIYYKLFTHQPVADIGAFAPRDYVNQYRLNQGDHNGRPDHDHIVEELNKQGWYQRYENNGWRPISDKLLRQADNVTEATSLKTQPFHHSKVVRREEKIRMKKKKKIEWLQKLYRLKGSEEPPEELLEEDRLVALKNRVENDDDDLDAEAQELLKWTDQLDFETYSEGWAAFATSGRSDDLLFTTAQDDRNAETPA